MYVEQGGEEKQAEQTEKEQSVRKKEYVSSEVQAKRVCQNR